MKRLLRVVILMLVRILGIPGVWQASRKARSKANEQIRILLVRPDHLGDVVLTTPVLNALRERVPQAHITMMVGPWSSEVVARHPAIDRLITCPFPGFQRADQQPLAPYTLLLSTAQQVRRGNFDIAINLRPDFWWGAALIYLARIPRRVGYALTPGKAFLTHTLPFSSPEHASRSNLRLLSAGLQALDYAALEEPLTPERYPLHFAATADERKEVARRLQAADISEGTPIVVIHPGTGGAVKLWRSEAWSHVANDLPAWLTSTMAPRIVLTGTRSEQSLLAEIARDMTSPVLMLTDLTVGQLAALLAGAHIVLGVDNGPLHLAVAQGTPTVQLFGPTDPRIFGPWGDPARHSVIASKQRCPSCPAIPCGRLDFTAEELPLHPCVRLIAEQRMEEAIQRLIHENTFPALGL
jgi:ADP-heptose:LPS heptosyltransferase